MASTSLLELELELLSKQFCFLSVRTDPLKLYTIHTNVWGLLSVTACQELKQDQASYITNIHHTYVVPLLYLLSG